MFVCASKAIEPSYCSIPTLEGAKVVLKSSNGQSDSDGQVEAWVKMTGVSKGSQRTVNVVVYCYDIRGVLIDAKSVSVECSSGYCPYTEVRFDVQPNKAYRFGLSDATCY